MLRHLIGHFFSSYFVFILKMNWFNFEYQHLLTRLNCFFSKIKVFSHDSLENIKE